MLSMGMLKNYGPEKCDSLARFSRTESCRNQFGMGTSNSGSRAGKESTAGDHLCRLHDQVKRREMALRFGIVRPKEIEG
jgi:hypothetical protein